MPLTATSSPQDLAKATLYRRGAPIATGSFWTPSRAYVSHCKGSGPNLKATIAPHARIRLMEGPARPRVIKYHLTVRRHDILVFQAWDADTLEYVVLNPSVLAVSRCR